MGRSNKFEYVTAPTNATESATISSTYFSKCNDCLMENKESEKCTIIEEQIEFSKCHWSHVVEFDFDIEEVTRRKYSRVCKCIPHGVVSSSYLAKVDYW